MQSLQEYRREQSIKMSARMADQRQKEKTVLREQTRGENNNNNNNNNNNINMNIRNSAAKKKTVHLRPNAAAQPAAKCPGSG